MTTTPSYFPADTELFYFWKGRVALYALLEALEIGAGDEVVMPAYTCVVVANACLYRGIKPVYADIDPHTYTPTAETIAPHITKNTRALIVQNTFGLSPDFDPILALAEEHGVHVIEDCAHGLGGSYKGQPNGTLAPFAFFSTQWSKPVTTGVGGIAAVRDPAIAERMRTIQQQMPLPSKQEEWMLYAQRIVRPLADIPALHYPLVNTYRTLTRQFGMTGSASGDELHSTEMPDGYLQRMGPIQEAAWHEKLAQLSDIVRKRQEAADYYDAYFQARGLPIPLRPDYADHAMLRYNVRVADREAAVKRAQDAAIPVGDWFVSPLHDVRGDLTPWHYQQGQCPVAEEACATNLNLFTDHPLTEKQLDYLFAEQ